MTKKNIMREFKINEISAVDEPAQKGARMVLMKRHNKADKENPLEDDSADEDDAGVLEAKLKEKKSANDGKTTKSKETDMTEEEKKAAALAAEKEKKDMAEKSAKLEADLKVAKALAELNDAEKAFYAKLDEKAQAEFLAKSADLRKNDIAKAAESNAVVYKSADGTEFRKSDDPRLVDMAKKNDELVKANKEALEKSESADFAKRADSELNFLKGTAAEKVALLKAVAGIADEAVRGKVAEMLKAANSSMSEAFKTLGLSKADPSSPSGKLDTLAKKYQADKNVSYAKAYDEVLKTAEGAELYNETQKK